MSNTQDNNRPDRDISSETTVPPSLEVEINAEDHPIEPIDSQRLTEAVIAAARYRQFDRGKIGILLTDDKTIHQLNQKHIGHDYPTDVISFGYQNQRPLVEGEMVVSVQTAERQARRLGWSPDSELLLYVVHGTLHITGMDDQQADQRAEMRKAERDILIGLGIDEIVHCGADSEGAGADGQTEELA